jgi:hypothetical protein
MGGEVKSFLGCAFNFKIGCFVVMNVIAWHRQASPRLELKTGPMFCPVISNLLIVRIVSTFFYFSFALTELNQKEVKISKENIQLKVIPSEGVPHLLRSILLL